MGDISFNVLLAMGYKDINFEVWSENSMPSFLVVKNYSEHEYVKKYHEIKKIKHWVDQFVGNIVKTKLFY